MIDRDGTNSTGLPRARALRFAPATVGVLLIALAACATPPPDPVVERLRAIADSRAVEAVGKMLGAYGGHPNWRQRSTVEYSYRLHIYGGHDVPQFVTHQLHRLVLGREVKAYIEDLDVTSPQIVRLDGPDIVVTRGGQSILDAALLDFPRAYGRIIHWSFRTPWTLIDPESRLESRGVRTPQARGPVPVGPCDVVRLRFEEPTAGGGIDDWQDFYISQRSGLVEQVHSYRSQDSTYRLSIWSDHRTIDGVRVASRRETYASDGSGIYGPLEAIAEYEDIRFDAPFDNAIFRTPISLAAPRGGE